jgi:hypothetical protein
MSFTNFLETELLDHVFGGNAYTAPSTLYVGLFTAAPGEAGGGTELSGNAYARQSCAMSVTGNTASNSANVEFPAATGSWGTVTHAAIFDASTGGNMLAYATLTSSKVVETGDILRFSTGQLQVTLD